MKILNKLIIIIILLFTYISSIYSDSINLFSDRNNYDINNIISFIIKIDYANKNINNKNIYKNLDINKIKGLEKFQVKSYSKTIQEDKGIIMYNISLTANQSGIYNIGPVNIDGIKSNILKISVTGDRQDIINSDDINSKKIEYFSQDLDNINLSKYNKNIVLDLSFKEMLDIYNIKQNEYGVYFSSISVKVLFISLVLLLSYSILEKYIFKKKSFIKKERKNKNIINTLNFKEELNNIKNNSINNKSEFYSKIGMLFRLFLEKEYGSEYKNISSKTFYELKGKINNNTYAIYKKIYFNEYNLKADNIKDREDIIEELSRLM